MKIKKCKVIDKNSKTEIIIEEKDFLQLFNEGFYGVGEEYKKYKHKKMTTYVIGSKIIEG